METSSKAPDFAQKANYRNSKRENICRMTGFITRFHIADFVALFACGVLSGILTGGQMNVVNGWISPGHRSLMAYYRGGQ